jgi:hypothetical protein
LWYLPTQEPAHAVSPALANAYGVRAIPTLAILHNGELLGTAPRLVRSEHLVEVLDCAAA